MKNPRRQHLVLKCLMALYVLLSGCSSIPPEPPLPTPLRVDGIECAGIDNSEQCARTIEARQLAVAGGRVTRSGARLCLPLQSGAHQCLQSGPEGAERSISYAYLGTLFEPRVHVIWTQFYEGNSILLVNATTGNGRVVDDMPIQSPDGKRLAVASLGLDVHYNPNSLEILRVEGEQLVSEWRLEPEGWGPGTPAWLAPGVVSFPQLALGGEADSSLSPIGVYRVTKSGEGWTGIALENGGVVP